MTNDINDPKLSGSARLPIHVQIAESLLRDITTGRLNPKDRLPPERALAQSLGVAVGTLRKALADLAERGVIERIHGSGNYVADGPLPESIYAFFNIELLEGGGAPSAQLLDAEYATLPNHLPSLPNPETALCIRRLRSLSGIPCVLEEIWLDGAYAQQMNAEDLSPSLYHSYARILGLRVVRAEDRLSTAILPRWAPEVFSYRTTAPVLCAIRQSWSKDGQLIEVSQNWIDTTRATYVARLR